MSLLKRIGSWYETKAVPNLANLADILYNILFWCSLIYGVFCAIVYESGWQLWLVFVVLLLRFLVEKQVNRTVLARRLKCESLAEVRKIKNPVEGLLWKAAMALGYFNFFFFLVHLSFNLGQADIRVYDTETKAYHPLRVVEFLEREHERVVEGKPERDEMILLEVRMEKKFFEIMISLHARQSKDNMFQSVKGEIDADHVAHDHVNGGDVIAKVFRELANTQLLNYTPSMITGDGFEDRFNKDLKSAFAARGWEFEDFYARVSWMKTNNYLP